MFFTAIVSSCFNSYFAESILNVSYLSENNFALKQYTIFDENKMSGEIIESI